MRLTGRPRADVQRAVATKNPQASGVIAQYQMSAVLRNVTPGRVVAGHREITVAQLHAVAVARSAPIRAGHPNGACTLNG